ncbi:MAG: SGNH/GDSL hydrolase family protein [Pirellulales bacterium]|nr:SGNH/GDSL hydrolase family protein [Pirellulales bacterium]
MQESSTVVRPPARRWRRLGLLILLGLVLILAVLAYRHFRFARPVGRGPAGPPVDEASFAKNWTARKVLLLGVGDSVTAGFGVARDHGYVARLADNPRDEWPDMQGRCLRRVLPNLSVRNEAVPGSTSLDHVKIIRERFEKQDADTLGLVVMTTGGNDLIHDYGRRPPREGAMYGATLEEARPWVEAFERRLDEMLDLLDDRFPGGCHVFLADIYDPSDGVGDPPSAGLPPWKDCLAVVGAYNEVIHRAADARPNVHLVPMHDAFLGHGVHCAQPWREHYRRDDPTYWYGWNLEDPNDRGYDAIRRLFLIEIARLGPSLD